MAHVFEDRALGRGRVVPLKVVVVPALESPALPDPVVYQPGGPGGAATETVTDTLANYGKGSAKRDFVFVDQRGMGLDSPLRCKLVDGTDLGTMPGGALPDARLRACLASMDADASLYTTAIAVDDLDEVLGALGYDKVNVLGESYGSFSGQAFAKAHPSRVRSLALAFVAAPNADSWQLGFAARAQKVFDQTVADCASNAECRARHPDPAGELAAALARFREHPTRVSVDFDGTMYQATFDADTLAMAIFGRLYSSQGRAHVLDDIHDAAEGKIGELARGAMGRVLGMAMELSFGSYLSINCGEALYGVTEEAVKRATSGTFLGTAKLGPILRACDYWPKRPPPPYLRELLHGDVPALLINGTKDEATPIDGVRAVAARLPHAQTVIVEGEGHGFYGACFDAIVASFFDAPLAKVDASCVKSIATP